jgi:SAM-dependent methyltransferase
MRVLDAGCGTGTVTRWMARQVGASGAAIGADISAAQVQVARREAARLGLENLSFHEAGIYDTGLAPASFDLVYCRFLLCHLNDPAAAVNEMRTLLRPGGVLLCEDVDVASTFCDPPDWAYHRMRDLMVELGRNRGVDYCLGPRLHRVFRQVGFTAPRGYMEQPVFLRGAEKRFWEHTFLEAAPAMLDAALTNPSELEQLRIGMARVAEDDTVAIAQARIVQVWAWK